MPTWRSFLLGVGGDWDLEIGAAAAACMAGCMAEGGAAALKPKFECIDNDDGGGEGGGGEKMGFAESWPSMKPLTHLSWMQPQGRGPTGRDRGGRGGIPWRPVNRLGVGGFSSIASDVFTFHFVVKFSLCL